MTAFKANDPQGKGTIPAKQLRHLLQNWGEGLSVREVREIDFNCDFLYCDLIVIIICSLGR